MMFWKTAVWLEMVPAVLGVADILMVKPVSGADYTQTVDYQQAIALGFTVDAVDTSQWASLSQSTFAQYRALLVNPYGISGGGSYAPLQFLTDTKNVWSPAVIGNMVLVGTDPGNHGRTIPGAANLINHAVNFAASGSGTGLYMQLPSNGGDPDTGTQIDALSYFGSFMYRTVSGDNNCHIVAQSPALGTLSDADISNWSYSVHGVFASYPNSSPNGALYTFQPLAIDKDRTGAGLQTYPDGTSGVPYILARGVTPQGCGDGVKQTSYGEQCDEGNNNGQPGSLCGTSCTCLYGVASDGTCVTPVCGDGTKQPLNNEQCDDGFNNGRPGSGCSLTCQCLYGQNKDGTCVAPVCGDNQLQPTNNELCDNGANNGQSGNACTATCQCTYGVAPDNTCYPAACGNRNKDSGEQCDDGANNGQPGSTCTATCTCLYGVDPNGHCYPMACGNGVKDTNEQCDDGAVNGGAESLCSAACLCKYGVDMDGSCYPAACGNTVIDPNEQCDDGRNNNQPASSCDASCRCKYGVAPDGTCYPAACGNTVVDPNEQCDDGPNNNQMGSSCDASCTCKYGLSPDGTCYGAYCGNGFRDNGEQCDDGAANNGQSSSLCDASCACKYGLAPDGSCYTALCGNTVVDPNEQCDDGPNNNQPASSCDASCTCKYGVSPDGTCYGAYCGNGFKDNKEECDDGSAKNGQANSLCDSSCACKYGLAADGSCYAALCGNGVKQGLEQCDDGPNNGNAGSLCNTSCACRYGTDADGNCLTSAPINTPPPTPSQPPTTPSSQPPAATPSSAPPSLTSDVVTPPNSIDTPSSPVSSPPLTTEPPRFTPAPSSTSSTTTDADIYGVESIFIVQVVTVTRGDSEKRTVVKRAVTRTDEQTLSIFSRDIPTTSVSGQPFYPALIGIPKSGQTITVRTTSTIGQPPDPTPVFQFQLCNTCAASSTVAPVPGYTPGACNGCNLVTAFDFPSSQAPTSTSSPSASSPSSLSLDPAPSPSGSPPDTTPRSFSTSAKAGTPFYLNINDGLENPGDQVLGFDTEPANLSWITFDPNTKTFSGAVPSDYPPGIVRLRVRAAGANGEPYDVEVAIAITPLNIAKSVTAGAPFAVGIGDYLPDASDVIRGVDYPPGVNWIQFDARTRTFSGTVPADYPAGPVKVHVRAYDPVTDQNYEFNVELDVRKPNDITPNTTPGSPFSTDLAGRLADPGDEILGITTDPSNIDWVQYDPATGTISGTVPPTYPPGLVTVHVQARNPRTGQTYSFDVQIVINNNTPRDPDSPSATPSTGPVPTSNPSRPNRPESSPSSGNPSSPSQPEDTSPASPSNPSNPSNPQDPAEPDSPGKPRDASLTVSPGSPFSLSAKNRLAKAGDRILGYDIDPSSVDWITYNPAAGTFSGTVPPGYPPGFVTIHVRAKDPQTGRTYTLNLQIRVSGEDNTVASPGGAFAIGIARRLANPSDTITGFTTDPSVDWVRYDATSQTFTGEVPAGFPPGVVTIHVRAVNAATGQPYEFDVQILVPPGSETTATVPGRRTTLDARGRLAEPGDQITGFTVDPQVSWITLDPSTGLFSVDVPADYPPGVVVIRVRAINKTTGQPYEFEIRVVVLDAAIGAAGSPGGRVSVNVRDGGLVNPNDRIAGYSVDPAEVDWISFDPATGTFSGTIPQGYPPGIVTIHVRAINAQTGEPYEFDIQILITDASSPAAAGGDGTATPGGNNGAGSGSGSGTGTGSGTSGSGNGAGPDTGSNSNPAPAPGGQKNPGFAVGPGGQYTTTVCVETAPVTYMTTSTVICPTGGPGGAEPSTTVTVYPVTTYSEYTTTMTITAAAATGGPTAGANANPAQASAFQTVVVVGDGTPGGGGGAGGASAEMPGEAGTPADTGAGSDAANAGGGGESGDEASPQSGSGVSPANANANAGVIPSSSPAPPQGTTASSSPAPPQGTTASYGNAGYGNATTSAGEATVSTYVQVASAVKTCSSMLLAVALTVLFFV